MRTLTLRFVGLRVMVAVNVVLLVVFIWLGLALVFSKCIGIFFLGQIQRDWRRVEAVFGFNAWEEALILGNSSTFYVNKKTEHCSYIWLNKLWKRLECRDFFIFEAVFL
jgi:hypothetical protein